MGNEGTICNCIKGDRVIIYSILLYIVYIYSCIYEGNYIQFHAHCAVGVQSIDDY